jgi:hypothetical protein
MNELAQARSELMELYSQTVDNFDAMLSEGVISEDDYVDLNNDDLDELNIYMSDLEGFDVSDDDDYEDEEEEYYDDEDENYSMGNDLATFSSGLEPNTRFGAALLELGYSVGYEDPTDLIEDLAEATGNSEQNIYELLMGEAAPDDNFALHASELFGLNEDLTLDLVAAGYEARGEDFEDILNEMEDESDEEEYEEEAVYSRVGELEDELATFKAEQVMKDALNEREAKAEVLVREGKMPPVIYEKLFANFNSDSDKIAAFSQVADANGVSLEAELHSIDKVLDVFNEMPELGVFTSYSDDLMTDEEYDEEMALQEQAQLQVQLRKQRQEGLI